MDRKGFLTAVGTIGAGTCMCAAVGGMRALWEGINAVANARFPGKTVIFPQCEDLPLTAVEDLPKLVPGIEATYSPDGCYTMATEKALFAKFARRQA